MWRSVFAWLLLVTIAPMSAADARDVYGFDTQAQEQRFQTLISELRCPKCQNQNIADSNAPISKDMRDEVYRMTPAAPDFKQHSFSTGLMTVL